jgi:hypothetical protein
MNKKQKVCKNIFIVLVAITILNFLVKSISGVLSEDATNYWMLFLNCAGEIFIWWLILMYGLKNFFATKDEKKSGEDLLTIYKDITSQNENEADK